MSQQPWESMTDAELIAAANRSEAGAFETLYLRYRDWVANLAFRFTGDRDRALDVMQDTFMYLLRKFPGFELTAQLKTFLYPVVRHNALAMKRQARQARRESEQSLADPASCVDQPPLELADLHAAMEALEAGHREVLILRFVDGLQLQEIALAMQLPLGTVKSRLHHAVSELRENRRLRRFFENP